jgi:hypothetical protein
VAPEIRAELETLYAELFAAIPRLLLAFEVRVFGDIAIAHGDYAVRSAAAGTRVSKVGTPFHFSDDSITLP